MTKSVLAFVALTLAAAVPAWAQGAKKDPEHARPRLVCEAETLAPGKTAWFGVAFDIDPDWHLYWNGQNDSGFPVKLETTVPTGYKAGQVLWPAPVRHVSPGDLLDHVYEKRVTLLLPVQVPATAQSGSKAEVKVNADWLVCKSACLPGSAELAISVPVDATKGEPAKSKDAPLFAEARGLLPKDDPGQGAFQAQWNDGRLTIRSLKDKEIAFYPGADSAPLAKLLKEGQSKDGKLELRPEKPGKVTGIVEIGPPDRVGRTLYRLETAPPGANSPAAGPSNPAAPSGG